MTAMTRRVRRGLLAIAGSLLVATAALAEAPQAKAQAPGYFRMMLGDFEVTALFDGTIDLEPTKLLMRTSPAHVKQALARVYEKEPLPTSVNAYLINTGRSSCSSMPAPVRSPVRARAASSPT